MNRMQHLVTWTLTVLVSAQAGSLAQAQPCEPNCPPRPDFRYRIIDLGTFGSDGSATYSNATGINEWGHVAGVAEDDSIRPFAFLYRDAELINLGSLDPNYPGSMGKGVNDLGHVVGQGMAPMGSYWVGHPFLWTEDEGMIDLAPDGWTGSGWAWGINNSTQVALTLNGPYYWDPVDGLHRIMLPGGPTGGDAWEINNDGLVVGTIRDPNTYLQHGFKYDINSATIVDLHDATSYRQSVAYGLNELGDVVGFADRYDHADVPMLWPRDGGAVELPIGDLRPDLYETMGAEHINSHGDIVGEDDSYTPGVFTEAWVAFETLSGEPIIKIALEWMISADDLAEWELTAAFEINDARQITGIGVHGDLTRAFLMTPYPLLPGDLDTDCTVGLADLAILLGNYGTTSGARPLEGDCDEDGDIDLADLAALLGVYGSSCE